MSDPSFRPNDEEQEDWGYNDRRVAVVFDGDAMLEMRRPCGTTLRGRSRRRKHAEELDMIAVINCERGCEGGRHVFGRAGDDQRG